MALYAPAFGMPITVCEAAAGTGSKFSVREGLNSALLRSRHDAMMSFRTRVVPWSYLRRKSHRDGLIVRCELGRPPQSDLVFGDSRRRADPRTPGCVRAHAKQTTEHFDWLY